MKKTVEQIGKSLNEVAAYGQQYVQQIRVKSTARVPTIYRSFATFFKVADHPNAKSVVEFSNGEDLKGDGLEANFKMVQDRFGATCHVRELESKDYPYAELIKLFRR